MKELFNELISVWKEETQYLSSDVSDHWALNKIVNIMGKDSLPLFFEEMESSPDWYFGCLCKIVDGPEILKEFAGRLDELTECWLKWAEENGYRR